jgi:hypothetical protein
MSYNPDTNMFASSVNQDTQGIAPGINAAGQAIASGVEQWASNRAASKAADLEYDTIQQMYPEAAANIDPEKFHAANLAGKQKLLGLAKGFVLESQQKNEIMRKQALMDKENVLRSQLNTITTKDGGTLIMTGDGRMVYSNRPDPVTPAPGPINEQTLPSGARVITQGGEIKRYLDAQQQQQGTARYEKVQGSNFSIPVDANGNRITNLPAMQTQRGPFAGGLSQEVPVPMPSAAGQQPQIRQGKDGNWYRVSADGVTAVPVNGAAAGAVNPPASGLPSFLNWNAKP